MKKTHTHRIRCARRGRGYQYMLNKRVEKDDADAKSNPQEADEFRGLTFMSLTFLNEATTSMEFAFFTTSSEAGAGASTSLPAISLSLLLSLLVRRRRRAAPNSSLVLALLALPRDLGQFLLCVMD